MVSGTAPVWPDGEVDPDVATQMRRCLEIVTDALASLGAGPADVVRTRTYLTDAQDWPEVGRVHGEVFGDVRPASTMVVVAALLDPRWRVEVEADAVIGAGRLAAPLPEPPLRLVQPELAERVASDPSRARHRRVGERLGLGDRGRVEREVPFPDLAERPADGLLHVVAIVGRTAADRREPRRERTGPVTSGRGRRASRSA